MENILKDKPKKMVYPYSSLSGLASNLMAYTGQPLEIDEDQEVPENCSMWEPPQVGPGMKVYYDGIGWCIGPDLDTVDFASVQRWVLQDLSWSFQQQVDQLTSDYTAAERMSWSAQLADAQAVSAGQSASPLLTTLASARGMTVQDLANKILDKDKAYQSKYAALLADYQKSRDQIEQANKTEDLPKVSIMMIKSFFPGSL